MAHPYRRGEHERLKADGLSLIWPTPPLTGNCLNDSLSQSQRTPSISTLFLHYI